MFRAVFIASVLTSLTVAAATSPQALELEMAKANKLMASGKRGEAITLMESLLAVAPSDGGLNFRYGYALYLESISQGKDGEPERTMRLKARSHLKAAEEAGLIQPLVQQLLVKIREDGSVVPERYSDNEEANLAMQRGEMAFMAHNMKEARVHYARALLLDPQLGQAALYIGDTHFAEKRHDEAQKWFTKAAELSPDLEQAHRYKGDSLIAQGKYGEALSCFVEAFVANPYGGTAWHVLSIKAREMNRLLSNPAPHLPVVRIATENDGVKLDLPKDANPITLAYGLARINHYEERKKAAKTSIGTYRQTLEEEVAALRLAIQTSAELGDAVVPASEADQVESLKKTRASLAKAALLDREGLLEAHILFLRANDDLAQDYAAYRTAHREKLRDYVRRYLVKVD